MTASASMAHEINLLERQLAQKKRVADLTAKAKPGELIEVKEKDQAGRQISRFYGDEGVAWEPFSNGIRLGRIVRP